MSRYHEAAYTLDPNQEVPPPEEAMPAAGTDEEQAEHVKELADGNREAAQTEAEERAAREQEAAERDVKPLPSELLQERGFEPAPAEDSEEQQSTTGTDVPDGTVQDVLDWAGDDPDRIQSALNAERAGQNRSSLISELEKRQAAQDDTA